jgi:hypothetical protein
MLLELRKARETRAEDHYQDHFPQIEYCRIPVRYSNIICIACSPATFHWIRIYQILMPRTQTNYELILQVSQKKVPSIEIILLL